MNFIFHLFADVEHYDPADVATDDLEDDDYTITLPGDADDEVDVDYIIQKLHLVKTKGQSKGKSTIYLTRIQEEIFYINIPG